MYRLNLAPVGAASRAAAVIPAIVGVIVAVGSGLSCFAGVMQLAVMVLSTFSTESVGLKIVTVSNVRVTVVVIGRGVEVTVGLRVVDGFVTVTGGSTVVLVKVV